MVTPRTSRSSRSRQASRHPACRSQKPVLGSYGSGADACHLPPRPLAAALPWRPVTVRWPPRMPGRMMHDVLAPGRAAAGYATI
jgi:hypothetical protein